MRGRAARAFARADELTGRRMSLTEWANAHNYYGLHFVPGRGRRRACWVFREWAPHATSMWLVGDFSGWKTDPAFEVFRIPGTDVWERVMPADSIRHLDKNLWGQAPGRTSFLPRFRSDLARYLPRAGRETVRRGPRGWVLK